MMYDYHKAESYGLSFICLLPLYIFLISAPSSLTLFHSFASIFLPFVLFISFFHFVLFFTCSFPYFFCPSIRLIRYFSAHTLLIFFHSHIPDLFRIFLSSLSPFKFSLLYALFSSRLFFFFILTITSERVNSLTEMYIVY
jgi:hypothetical protein